MEWMDACIAGVKGEERRHPAAKAVESDALCCTVTRFQRKRK
jgi:hypothetical protein